MSTVLDDNVRAALDELARAVGALDFRHRHAFARVLADRARDPERGRATRQLDGALAAVVSAVQHVAILARDGEPTSSARCELVTD
jgi:hypothetical protein